MTDEPEFNIRGPLLLLVGDMACWKCSASTRVGSLAGLAETEAWLDDAEPPRWIPFGDPGAVQRITAMSPEIKAAVRAHLPTYHPAFSQAAEMGYWMNHALHAKQAQVIPAGPMVHISLGRVQGAMASRSSSWARVR